MSVRAFLNVRDEPHRLGWGVIAVLTGTVASLFKEQGFVVVLLWGLVILGRGRSPYDSRAFVGLSAGLALSLLWRFLVLGSVGGGQPASFLLGIDWVDRVMTAVGLVPEYVRLLAWPWDLHAEYSPPGLPVGRPFAPRHALGLGLIVTWAVTLVHQARSRGAAGMGLGWTAVALLPVCHLVFPGTVLLAERVMFLPSVGVALVLGGLVDWLLPRVCSRPVLVTGLFLVGAAWILTAMMTSRSRMDFWRSNAGYYEALAADAPESYMASLNAGLHWRVAGEPDRAERDLRRALALHQADPRVFEALGQLLRERGRCEDAIPVLRQGLALDPTRTQLRAKLGECALTVGDSAMAKALAREAIMAGDAGFELLERRAQGSAGSTRTPSRRP